MPTKRASGEFSVSVTTQGCAADGPRNVSITDNGRSGVNPSKGPILSRNKGIRGRAICCAVKRIVSVPRDGSGFTTTEGRYGGKVYPNG